MNLDFDFQSIKATEFGVGRNGDDHQTFFFVPVDGKVQAVLHEMAVATWDAMQAEGKDPAGYEPSEKYASAEYVYLPLNHALAEGMRQLHTANNLLTDSHSLEEPAEVFCYVNPQLIVQGHRQQNVQGHRQLIVQVSSPPCTPLRTPSTFFYLSSPPTSVLPSGLKRLR
jgi:hypothetical protein